MLDFGDLKLSVLQLADRVDDSNYDTKVGVWLQLSEKLLSEIYDYWTELQGTYNFTSVASTEAYDMPADFDKSLRVYDLTNKKKINPITEEEYSDSNISNIADATEGIPDKYRIYGVVNRRKQLKLGKIPDDAYSYRVLYKKVPAGMTSDDDYAFMDADRYLIFDAYGYALKQEKEDQRANFAWQKAEEALTALLNNQMSKLSPEFQHKSITKWAQAHRT